MNHISNQQMIQFLLRIAMMRLGGEMVVEAHSDEVARSDGVTVFVEGLTDRSIKVTIAYTDDSKAGHAD